MQMLIGSKNVNPFLLNRLRIHTFSPKQTSMENVHFAKAYELWKSTWSHVLKNEMNVRDALTSDKFTKPEMLVAIFDNSNCAGLFTVNRFDLENKSHTDDSFFVDWDAALLERLREEESEILCCENFTVNPELHQDRSLPFAWKELLGQLTVRTKHEYGHSNMIGACRQNRGMSKLAVKCGAKTMASNIKYKIPGEIADLMIWDRESESRIENKDCWELIQELWKSRIDWEKRYSIEQTIGGKHAI